MGDQYREKALEAQGERCQICESTVDLVVHHIDGDRNNDEIENLLVVCDPCHTKIHTPEENGEDWDQYTKQLPIASLYGVSPSEKPLVRKTATIRHDQKAWLAENTINFSKFIRKKIDEEIRKKGDFKTGDYFKR